MGQSARIVSLLSIGILAFAVSYINERVFLVVETVLRKKSHFIPLGSVLAPVQYIFFSGVSFCLIGFLDKNVIFATLMSFSVQE